MHYIDSTSAVLDVHAQHVVLVQGALLELLLAVLHGATQAISQPRSVEPYSKHYDRETHACYYL
jgi:hypothetical protein